MSYVDEVSKQLYSYRPPLTKREDFDEFWGRTLEKTRSVPLNPCRELYDYPSPFAEVYDISYNGFDDTRVHGWFLLPKFAGKSKLPCLVHYHGFTLNRGRPANFMHWLMLGAAVLSVDCREQTGETGNSARYSAGHSTNLACKGILDKDEFYYRAVYMDCVKAIDFALSQPEVDGGRVIIEGASQGGALGMAVCSLDPRPRLAMVDVPSNSNLEKRVEGAHGAFASVADYLKLYPDRVDKAFETLSYFDTMNMADRIGCRLLASVALKDNICPAVMYFASYNRITSPKEIRIYPFNGHEGGGDVHTEVKLRFLMKNL